IERMARTGEVEPPQELQLLRKDGSLVPVYSSHALTKRDGLGYELFCLDIDLSEQKRAEATQEALEERLRQSQKMDLLAHSRAVSPTTSTTSWRRFWATSNSLGTQRSWIRM
ncbi:MAG: hypothetical protein ACKO15_15455, partial [Burkholderiales bacterium]